MRKAIAVVAGAFLLVSTLAMLDQATAQRRRARAEDAKWEFVKARDLGFDGANTAEDDSDPENAENDVVSVDTEPATDGNTLRVGALSGNLDNRTKIADLDN